MLRTLIVIICLNIFASHGVFSQRLTRFSVRSLYQEQSGQLTSAVRNRSRDFFQIGGIFPSGLFREFRSFYVSGSKTLSKETDQQAVGFVLMQDERGELITETRIELMYRVLIPINPDVKIGLGTHTGLYQMGLQPSSTTAGDNDRKFNINLSAGLNATNWNAGLYVMNIVNPEFQILNSRIRSGRVAGLYFSSDITEQKDWKSRASFLATRVFEKNYLLLNLDQTLYKKFGIGIQVGNKAVGIYGGLSEYNIGNRQLNLSLGYQLSFDKGDLSNVQRLQLLFSLL